jgi:hypothetical protein
VLRKTHSSCQLKILWLNFRDRSERKRDKRDRSRSREKRRDKDKKERKPDFDIKIKEEPIDGKHLDSLFHICACKEIFLSELF